MSYNKLGFTSGQTLKAEHLNHMEEGIANVSWSDLTDKPFGEEVVTTNSLTWDGNSTGKETVSINGAAFVKVGDATITAADMIGGSVTVTSFNSDTSDETIVMDENAVSPIDDGVTLVFYNGQPFVIVVGKDTFDFEGAILTRGVYFVLFQDYGYTSNLTLTSDIEVLGVKTIDEKYLPDNDVFTAIITCRTEDEYGVYECNKTFDEVIDAINSCKYIDIKELVINAGHTMICTPTYGITFHRRNSYIAIEGSEMMYWTANGISLNQPSGGK